MAALVPAGCSQWKMVETAPAPGGRDITSRARGLGPLEQADGNPEDRETQCNWTLRRVDGDGGSRGTGGRGPIFSVPPR